MRPSPRLTQQDGLILVLQVLIGEQTNRANALLAKKAKKRQLLAVFRAPVPALAGHQPVHDLLHLVEGARLDQSGRGQRPPAARTVGLLGEPLVDALPAKRLRTLGANVRILQALVANAALEEAGHFRRVVRDLFRCHLVST